MLSKEAVVEYQKVYKKVYGKEISYKEALEQGIRLINLFRAIYKPITKNKYTDETKKKIK